MKLKVDNKLINISGVTLKSNEVNPGFAFFCIRGAVVDGHKFAKDAAKKGASVIFVEYELDHLFDKDGNEVPQVVVDDTHKAAAEIAAEFYGYPSRECKLIGITGTNGKTTTSSVVSHVLQNAGLKTAVIGTTGVLVDGKHVESEGLGTSGLTTPDSIAVQHLLRQLVDKGVEAIVMEVSSIALVQKRVYGCEYDVCAFTNLTQDHLDIHKDMQDYFAAKCLLFGPDYPSAKVVCVDDEWGQQIAEICEKQNLLTCGMSLDADVNPSNFECDFPLIGKFNTQNMLVATSICKRLGLDNDTIKQGLKTTPQVDGRMQVVLVNSDKFRDNYDGGASIKRDKKSINDSDDKYGTKCSKKASNKSYAKLDDKTSIKSTFKLPKVVVDYAHTPDALKNAAATLAEVAKNQGGKLITVFGCGGNRDKTKRPQMAQQATEISDITIITTDNPRNEEPEDIIEDIKAGIVPNSITEIVVDREDAIKRAIEIATDNDIILVAGKGHEDYQEVKGVKHHFDDREVAAQHLQERAGCKQ